MAKQTILIADLIGAEMSMRRIVALDKNVEIVGDVQDMQALVEQFRGLRPDVVLLNVDLPGGDSLDSVKILKEILPEVAYLYISLKPKPRVSFIQKGANLMELVSQICKGKEEYPQLSNRLLMDFQGLVEGKPDQENHLPGGGKVHLTRREIEVISFLARGYNDRKIAGELVISEKTVRNHIRNIRQKLRVDSRIQVALFAVQRGLVDIEEISLGNS